MSDGKLLLILTISLLLFSSNVSLAQHRDESQMLRKPGASEIHARAHSRDTKNLRTQMPSDSVKASDAAAPTASDQKEEPADEFLQAGIRMLNRGDYVAALKSFGEASRRGNHEAQYRIGLMYRDGVGLNRDSSEAAYWFRKAGSNGHAGGQYEIAVCFMQGRGVLQDSRVAAEWFWRAAENGHPKAAFYLARMYRDGVGMNKDLRKAAKYMSQAAEAGIPEAASELEEIKGAISRTPGANAAKKPSRKGGK